MCILVGWVRVVQCCRGICPSKICGVSGFDFVMRLLNDIANVSRVSFRYSLAHWQVQVDLVSGDLVLRVVHQLLVLFVV